MPLNLVHLHLLLNHVPTVGTVIALGLLLLSIGMRSDDVRRASLAVFFALALAALPTYMTGYSAQAALKGRPGVSADTVDRHQRAALLALVVIEVTGVVAWFGLWQSRRRSSGGGGHTAAVLLLSVATVSLMANAANIAGTISHPDILAKGETVPTTIAPEAFRTSLIARYQFSHPMAWPTLETLHFIGLCLLFGIVLVGNLRILGLMKTARFADIHRLLPWGVLGFVINSVTGMLFFVGQAFQYIDNPAFHWKVVFMLLAGANVLYLTLFDDVWALEPGENAPAFAKFVAASQVFLWVGVIYFGRMLPYIGNAF